MLSRDFPCAKDANLIGITPAECERVYDFRHVLNFTSNVTELETRLNNARLSASLDNPEGILDAVLQAAVCEVRVIGKGSSVLRTDRVELS